MPPGVCEESAICLRQAEFYSHSIFAAGYSVADSHTLDSQAITDGFKLDLNFSGLFVGKSFYASISYPRFSTFLHLISLIYTC